MIRIASSVLALCLLWPAMPAVAAAAPAPAAAGTRCGAADFPLAFVRRINSVRATGRMCGGLSQGPADPLRWNLRLSAAAAAHAGEMAGKDYFSHKGANGSRAGQRIAAHGYDWDVYGENIAAGQETLEQAMQAWLESPGHCEILMKRTVTEVGAACVRNSDAKYETYWVMEVGHPSQGR